METSHFIKEMQQAPEGRWVEIEKIIEGMDRQLKHGVTKEISYHAQLSLLYSILKDVENTRLHAAQVPETAPKEDKRSSYFAIARMLIYKKKVAEAIDWYNRLIEMDDTNDMAFLELGWCLHNEKRFEEAANAFERGVRLEEDSFELWEGFALSLAMQDKFREAIPSFKKAMEFDTRGTQRHYYEYMIGLCYERMNDFYRSLAHYSKSLEAKPDFINSLNNIAALYYNEEADVTTAISYLKKAEIIAVQKDDKDLLQLVYINLGRLYGVVLEFDKKEYYNSKLWALFGLPPGEDLDDEDDWRP